jgi:hypothetical protein
MWSPDVDMTHQAVTLLDGTTPGSVAPNVLTKFRILIPNNKAGASQLGVTATCVVFIDNVPQIPGVTNGFSYLTGPVLNVPWNGNGDCQFQAKLTPGAHTIYAVAAPIFPDDYDYTNNKSATISVSAIADAPDVATGVFWVNGSAPAPGATVGTGTVVNLAQWVQLLSGTPPGTVTCTATITPAAGVSPSTITTRQRTRSWWCRRPWRPLRSAPSTTAIPSSTWCSASSRTTSPASSVRWQAKTPCTTRTSPRSPRR